MPVFQFLVVRRLALGHLGQNRKLDMLSLLGQGNIKVWIFQSQKLLHSNLTGTSLLCPSTQYVMMVVMHICNVCDEMN